MSLLTNLLPLSLGSAVLPLWIIMTLILLRGKRGLVKASAFVAGGMTLRVMQFVLFSRVFGAIVSAEGEDVFDLIPATLLLLTGLFLLITAVRTWWRWEDTDAPPPKWMRALGTVTPVQAFGVGFVMMLVALKQWVFTLAAIALIDDAELPNTQTILVFGLFVLIAHSLMLAPVLYSAAAPYNSAKFVNRSLSWLERNNRAITIVASCLFGAWFTAKGTSALVAQGLATAP